MASPLEIREARPEEYAAVGRLTADVYVEDGLVPADSPYVEQLADASTRAAHAELLVALDDGTLVGTVTFVVHGSPYTEVADPGEAEIRMLAVRGTARGRGIGEALVRESLERARAVTLLRLSTQSSMVRALPIYKRLGFARTPERDWSPNPDVELRAYELKLV
jgi:ribosomal protein S18 acetylase RimI-like enzyme